MIHGVGSCARLVADMLIASYVTDRSVATAACVTPCFSAPGDVSTELNLEQVVLLSRNADLVSPLCSQLIYGGLVDDVFGFSGTQVRLSVKKQYSLFLLTRLYSATLFDLLCQKRFYR